MTPTRRQLLATVSATGALALAGCAGDGGGDATTTTTTTTADGDPVIQVGTHEDHGEILVDGDGRTLYMFDQDTQGGDTSSCTDGCADAWPPHTTADTPVAGDAVTAPLATIDRGDGSTQITADGWPLYRYAQDGEPGDATGQGVGGVWWVLAPDGTPTRETSTTTTTTTTDDDGGIY